MVLVRIQTSLKQDLNSSTAELVYGTTLSLPGDFVQSNIMQIDPATCVASEWHATATTPLNQATDPQKSLC